MRVPKIKLLPGEHQREYVLTDEAIEKFEKEEGLIGKIVPFLVDTGLRRGEAIGLTWTDVNFSERWVQIIKGKTKFSRRKVPLTKRAERILVELKPQPRPRMSSQFGRRFTSPATGSHTRS